MITLDAQLQSRMAMLARLLVHHPERAREVVPRYILSSDPEDYKLVLGELKEVEEVTWYGIQSWVRSADPHRSYAGKILRWAYLKEGLPLPSKSLGSRASST